MRWFTPGGEIDLCGHATLGTAYVLLNFMKTGCDRISFQTKSGQLIVKKQMLQAIPDEEKSWKRYVNGQYFIFDFYRNGMRC